MNLKNIVSALSLAAIVSSCAQDGSYKVIAPIADTDDGDIAYLYNFDTGEKIDSVVITDHSATFTGKIDEPIMARIIVNGNRVNTFVLEQGTIAISPQKRRAVGSMLNDELNAYIDSVQRIEEIEEYMDYTKGFINENIDNALGYYVFLDYGNTVDSDEMLAFIDENPELKSYKRVQSLIDGAKLKAETSEGKMYKDFEVTYNGVTKKLSDYVGKGDYVLVDFWASWCGPCIREIETLKDINSKYADKGLKLLGVAVWDEPKNTEAAIERLQIPWEVIINAQTIPTDLYGIPGIPCIILFGPDGTILSRDKQGEELKADVEKHLGARQ